MKRSTSQHTGNKVSTKTIFQSTVESDNKRRPIVLRKNSRKYYPPSPEPPDPNSGNQWIEEGGYQGNINWNNITEAKSATIRRMQNNLEDWNKQLKEIMEKKERDGRSDGYTLVTYYNVSSIIII